MNNSNASDPGAVPKRWMDCPRKSSTLIANKFLAFKVPLSEAFDKQVPQDSLFHPQMLIDIANVKRYNLGLWLDLTNTKRFYESSVVEQNEIKYLKLACKGHGETPSEEQTRVFIKIVSTFIAQNPLKSIAIHCTHGFNRTGFLIVSYLVEEQDYDLPVALAMFAEARPPGIYKGDYLQELYNRHRGGEDTPPPPELPSWCFEEDADKSDDDEQATSNADNYQYRANRKVKPAQFMAGVPGVLHFTEQPKAFQLQRKVQTMCGWKMKGFPGSQPVSMDKENISLLSKKAYRVSWKADGMRYLMLIDGQEDVYFFDRDHNVFQVKGLWFPHRKDHRRHLCNTLIDGEMVIDKHQGKEIPRYLAYDIIQFEANAISKEPFHPVRLACLDLEIIKPRHEAIESGFINKASEPFSIRLKYFWDVTQASNLLGEKFAATLLHEPDGLIFQPSKEPYVAGRCDDVLKWKPLNLNSIDFRLKIVEQSGIGIITTKVCQLYVGKMQNPFAKMPYSRTLKDLDGKIIECTFENDRWKFMRERTDKTFPNSYTTAIAVMNSIRSPVTKELLIDQISKHPYVDDAELMPPPAKRRAP